MIRTPLQLKEPPLLAKSNGQRTKYVVWSLIAVGVLGVAIVVAVVLTRGKSAPTPDVVTPTPTPTALNLVSVLTAPGTTDQVVATFAHPSGVVGTGYHLRIMDSSWDFAQSVTYPATTMTSIPLTYRGAVNWVVIAILNGVSVTSNAVSYALDGGTTTPTPNANGMQPTLASIRQFAVDTELTAETATLFYKLWLMCQDSTRVIFGMHEPYTRSRKVAGSGFSTMSDIESVSRLKPGVIGIDFDAVASVNSNQYQTFIDDKVREVKWGHKTGAAITASWHYHNPATDADYKSAPGIVARILPNGNLHEKFKTALNKIAAFCKRLVDDVTGRFIPVIFRPFHEMNADFFWWGHKSCTDDEYKTLWRFIVTYLRDVSGLHHLLYAYSPNSDVPPYTAPYQSRLQLQWVDVLGIDNYVDYTLPNAENAKRQYETVSTLALQQTKIFAITEFGDNVKFSPGLFDTMLTSVKGPAVKAAYMSVWWNDATTVAIIPKPGESMVQEFLNYTSDPLTLFAGEFDLRTKKNGCPRAVSAAATATTSTRWREPFFMIL